jgi:hypothetical protein
MGLRDRLRRLEHSAEGEIATLVCQECGEEQRERQGIILDLTALDWQMHMADSSEADELPADTPPIYAGYGSTRTAGYRWWTSTHTSRYSATSRRRRRARWKRGKMGLRDKMRRLERAAEGELVTIPQRDGSTRAFEKMYAMGELFLIRYHAALGEEHRSEFTDALKGATEESRRVVESLSSGAFMEDLEPAYSAEPVEDLSE